MMYPTNALYGYSADAQLAGWFTSVKKATTRVTKKVTRAIKKTASKVGKGVCKATQSQAGQVGAGAAGTMPHPAAQTGAQAIQLIASLCPTPETTAVTDPNALAALEALAQEQQPEPFYKNPYVIGGGIVAAGLIAYLALKK